MDLDDLNDASQLLAVLGGELSEPLESLVAEVHALDAKGEDDDAARLVELAHRLRTRLQPLTTLAAYLRGPEGDDSTLVDLNCLVRECCARPQLAAAFQLVVRGELGDSFDDETHLREGLALCLELIAGMTTPKARLAFHRERHSELDRVVLSVQLFDPSPVGLGLLKCTVNAMKGELELDDRRLLVSIPARPRPAVPDASAIRPSAFSGVPAGPVLAFRRHEGALPEPPPDAPPRIVLFVETEPAARDYVGRVLELEGFEAVASGTLEDAYAKAHTFKPEAIMVDRLQIAHEGEGWLRRFREDPALARIPLIVVQSPESESLGLVAAAGVVQKPIDPEALVKTIESLTSASPSPVLVVRPDDDRLRWQEYLEGGERRMIVKPSVPEAEALLDVLTPAALVVDAKKLEGVVDLLERMRSSERLQEVPVVIVHGTLPEKARLELEELADARLGEDEVSRRTLRQALSELTGEDPMSDAGTG